MSHAIQTELTNLLAELDRLQAENTALKATIETLKFDKAALAHTVVILGKQFDVSPKPAKPESEESKFAETFDTAYIEVVDHLDAVTRQLLGSLTKENDKKTTLQTSIQLKADFLELFDELGVPATKEDLQRLKSRCLAKIKFFESGTNDVITAYNGMKLTCCEPEESKPVLVPMLKVEKLLNEPIEVAEEPVAVDEEVEETEEEVEEPEPVAKEPKPVVEEVAKEPEPVVEEVAKEPEPVVDESDEVSTEIEEEPEEEEEELELEEIVIKKKKYYKDTNSDYIYKCEDDDSAGDLIGKLVNGKLVFI
jgi:hypothetical protein